MKKTRIAGGGHTAKSEAPKTAREYFARVPLPARRVLTQMHQAIRSTVPPDTVEVISYRMPAFKRGHVLVWYGAFAHHVSLFPGGSVLRAFKDELRDFKTSTGTVQFPIDKPLPIRLIKRIVKARVAEVDGTQSR
jgi:uncharacterized protein YdhG (YjbR/CyaY superfamily)